jgi:hypothetical protein
MDQKQPPLRLTAGEINAKRTPKGKLDASATCGMGRRLASAARLAQASDLRDS